LRIVFSSPGNRLLISASRKWLESVTPLGRVGKAEEIASEGASCVTGETLHVTGGFR
jgi:hypothetical protein